MTSIWPFYRDAVKAREACGPVLLVMNPQPVPQLEAQLRLDQPLWFSLLQEAPQQKPSENFEEQAFLQVPEGTRHASGPHSHTVQSQVERGRGRGHGARPFLGRDN